ncbi:MAG: hypothetical protein CMJ31_12895 [Phycisphaerae bacterium]|nr:hypothetical protein [Phycisphaerae bacterium]
MSDSRDERPQSHPDDGPQYRPNDIERVASDIMPLGDHLEDLRRRLILGLLGIAPIAITAFVFGTMVLDWLTEPLLDQLRKAGQAPQLIQTGVFEVFAAYMQLSLVAAVLVGSPWLLYQLWKFIAPGLYPQERKLVHLLVPMSGVLTICGAAFMYFVVLPVILRFFIDFGTGLSQMKVTTVVPPPDLVFPKAPVLPGDPIAPAIGDVWVNSELQQWRVAIPRPNGEGFRVLGSTLIGTSGVVPQLRVREYQSTVLNLALAFAIAFQTPVVVLLLGWVRIVTPAFLRKYRRWAIMIAAVAGAVLTPADPLSMMLLAIPLYLLFELGVILLVIFPPSGRNEPIESSVEDDVG